MAESVTTIIDAGARKIASRPTGGFIVIPDHGIPVECRTLREVFAAMGWPIPPEHEAAIDAYDGE